MTRRRWIADEVSESHAALVGEHADHLIRVLRARVGQEFDIATDSAVRRGRVTSIGDGRVDFELGEELGAHSSANITLLLSIFKFDRMEWAIEKCTELGVTKIVPVIARRTDAHLAAASAKRVERWRKIALQAAEQSRRSAAAEITAPMRVQQAIKLGGAIRILLNESEQDDTLREVLSTRKGNDEILLAIGPEGGWAEDELQCFVNEGWILRVETAAIAATAVTIAE